MGDSGKAGGRQRRRSLLGIGTVTVMALVLALAAASRLIDVAAALTGILALATLAAVSVAMLRSGYSARFSDSAFVCGQVAAAFVLLAWMTYCANATPAIALLYPVAMLYGMLQLDRSRLAILAALALVLHGTALFMLIGDGHRVDLAAVWTQFGALVLALAWFTYAAGAVLRLRHRLAEAHGQLHELAARSEERASRDALTGTYHHRHLMEALEREIARAERVGKPLSVARVDLDWLGSVNEAHGHAAGDVALKRFTLAASGALRDVDVFGRYGGKEFLAIMPDTDLSGASVAAERILQAVRREPLPETRGERNLSCTLGVTEHRGGENLRLLLGRAETALVYAKAAGRGRFHAQER
jgi:diguanylate cyclase (GGDEF)-like protein